MAKLAFRSLPNWELFDPETKWLKHQEDLDFLAAVEQPTIEDVIEYAARVCYNSADKMGKSPNFLQKKIMQTGHHDVIEHGYAAVWVGEEEMGFEKYIQAKHVEPGHVLAGGNIRAWYDLREKYDWIEEVIGPIAPNIFGSPIEADVLAEDTGTGPSENVMLLASSGKVGDFGHATFLVSGISRACGYQLVRHRTLSFSQESQRYTDTSKSGPIYPKAILEHDIASELAQTIHNLSVEAYEQMRELGITKEDARSVLLNMAPTRMVVSGDVLAWRHFLSLRTAKDAQEEIRNVADQIKSALTRAWGSI